MLIHYTPLTVQTLPVRVTITCATDSIVSPEKCAVCYRSSRVFASLLFLSKLLPLVKLFNNFSESLRLTRDH